VAIPVDDLDAHRRHRDAVAQLEAADSNG